MVRTRVGYAGGTTENPTYRNIGDQNETIQIEYDPTQISYEELLDMFWRSHVPEYRPPPHGNTCLQPSITTKSRDGWPWKRKIARRTG